MRRITKKLLILLIGLILIAFYCEFLIYYFVIMQCRWPSLENTTGREVLRVFILADTHLLGPYRGHWLDKLRREWQMHQAFQTIINVHKPEAVIVLGDLFDEGEWSNDKQFQEYIRRFYKLFSVPDDIKMIIAVGNHDIGFHNRIRRGFAQRFSKYLKAPSVQHIVLKDNHFIVLNSMALEGDSCNLCTEARNHIENLSNTLKRCSSQADQCEYKKIKFNYSRPILMQHFPLYRLSDAICTEPDAPPLPEKKKLFRMKIDALSKESTDYIISKFKPRVVFGGHTHHGCLVEHDYKSFNIHFKEYSVPSFSWRNRPDPKYLLVSITPDEYAVEKCALPKETTIALSAVIMIIILIFYVTNLRLLGRYWL